MFLEMPETLRDDGGQIGGTKSPSPIRARPEKTKDANAGKRVCQEGDLRTTVETKGTKNLHPAYKFLDSSQLNSPQNRQSTNHNQGS